MIKHAFNHKCFIVKCHATKTVLEKADPSEEAETIIKGASGRISTEGGAMMFTTSIV